jgi:hypothetical protein
MIEAPTLQDIQKHRENFSNSLGAIIFAPKFSKRGYDEIIQRLEYLNRRTGKNLHFYCAGYGAYQPDILDTEKLNISIIYNETQIPWTFSQGQFAQFVNDLEDETNWTYAGNNEIIILDNSLNFKSCIVLKLDEMIKDKIIDNPNEIIEALIQYSKKNKKIEKISLSELGKITTDEIIKSILSCLPKSFENIWNIWNNGKHYTLIDLK